MRSALQTRTLPTTQVHKRRRFSGKCSTKPPKQQQTPEKKLRRMFHNYANSATKPGEKTPANVPKNGQNARAV